MMASTFADLFDETDDDDSESESFLQQLEKFEQGPEELPPDAKMEPPKKKIKFARPPVPQTKVPSNPCTDPNKGAPSPEDKRAAKCTIKKSPQCYKLQSRFLSIQGGIQDERDKLLEDIATLEA